MDINAVMGIVVVSLFAGVALIALGLYFRNNGRPKSQAAITIAIGATVMVAVMVQFVFCVHSEPVSGEYVIEESHPIAEGGVSLRERQSGSSLIGWRGVIVGRGGRTKEVYTVEIELEDGGVKSKDFNTDSVNIYEDAKSWADARIDKVLKAEANCSGTFFGVPVSGTKTSGSLSEKYNIHVPEGFDAN